MLVVVVFLKHAKLGFGRVSEFRWCSWKGGRRRDGWEFNVRAFALLYVPFLRWNNLFIYYCSKENTTGNEDMYSLSNF